MRVHHACSHLDQLSGVSDEQNLRIAAVRCVVERLTDEVGALDRAFKIKAERVPREIRAVVARAQERNALSLRVQAVQLQSDGVHERLFAHRLDNAARAEDRDAADDAEVPVVGLGGKRLAVLHRNGDGKAAAVSVLLCGTVHRVRNLLPRTGIDRRFSDRHRQSRAGNPTDAGAALYGNALFDSAHGSRDADPVCDVRVVARVLADGADRRVSAHMRVLDRQAESDAARRVQVNLRRRDSGQQQHSRRLRGRRRARAGCPAAAKRFAAAVGGEFFVRHAVHLPVKCNPIYYSIRRLLFEVQTRDVFSLPQLSGVGIFITFRGNAALPAILREFFIALF